MLIDTHAHFYAEDFDADRDASLEHALAAGVELIILPNIDTASIEPLKALRQKWPQHIEAMMGLHPCYVKANYMSQLASIKTELFNGDYCAVGEIGIDLHWDKTTLDMQREAFATQIAWAKELAIPICIHARESLKEIFDVLSEVGTAGLSGVFHCFIGDEADVAHILTMENFYFGIGGVLTFKNGGMSEVAKMIPLDRILLETDSPYLSPTPHRGKRNEPAYTLLIAEKLAEVRGISLEETAEATTFNARKLFNLNHGQ